MGESLKRRFPFSWWFNHAPLCELHVGGVVGFRGIRFHLSALDHAFAAFGVWAFALELWVGDGKRGLIIRCYLFRLGDSPKGNGKKLLRRNWMGRGRLGYVGIDWPGHWYADIAQISQRTERAKATVTLATGGIGLRLDAFEDRADFVCEPLRIVFGVSCLLDLSIAIRPRESGITDMEILLGPEDIDLMRWHELNGVSPDDPMPMRQLNDDELQAMGWK